MEHKQCPLCTSSEIIRIKNYEKYFLSKCTSCSFVFTYKIPEKQELKDYYLTYGLYTYLSPITIKRYDDILSGFEKYRNTNKILDIGCGAGYFLDVAKKHGWDTYGIEYSDEAVNICKEKGINMMDAENFYSNQIAAFDVIIFTEVIEHLPFPCVYTEHIFKCLRQGGLLYITTPNFNSLSRFLIKKNWAFFNYPEHLSFFTVRTLVKELKRVNFNIINIKTHGISLSRIKSSIKNIQETEDVVYKNVEDEKIRELIEEGTIFQVLKNIVNFFLNIAKKGDTIKCNATKN